MKYTVTLVRFVHGRRTRRISKTIKFRADPARAYEHARSLCGGGWDISTLWYDWPQ